MMSNLSTPLRYPGGKRKLGKFLEQYLFVNNLHNCVYAEPFAGGAGLALYLLKKGLVSHLYLNDVDINIFSFWESVLYRNEALCKMIVETPVTMEQWYQQKEKLGDSDPLTRGFATFFLNRTNRSGIILAGVIGGKEQKGKWKLDCRFNKKNLIDRIRSIGKVAEFVSFYNDDAEDFLKKVCFDFCEHSVTYIDPPYYVKGAGLYENHYKHEDHERLAGLIQEMKNPWIVSYDNHDSIKRFYSGSKKIEYTLNYSAQKHVEGKEVVFCGNSVFPNNCEELL